MHARRDGVVPPGIFTEFPDMVFQAFYMENQVEYRHVSWIMPLVVRLGKKGLCFRPARRWKDADFALGSECRVSQGARLVETVQMRCGQTRAVYRSFEVVECREAGMRVLGTFVDV
jgi:hypothetical protein